MERLLYKTLIIVLLVSSCTVHKNKEDQSFLSKLYHNTTARYNGYFNADLLMQESMAALTQEYVETYDTILPVYPYMANPNVENQYNTLDKVIEKVTTVSSLHRQSHWLDDNYLMLGKAQFLKKNYKEAGAAFTYLVSNFDPIAPNEEARQTEEDNNRSRNSRKAYKQREKEQEQRRKEINKKRKQARKEAKKRRKSRKNRERPSERTTPASENTSADEPLLASASEEPTLPGSGNLIPQASNPDQYFMKHKPAYQEGLLWEARTWTAQENYFSAEARLSMLVKDPNTSVDIRHQALIALIDSYIKSQKYRQALQTIDQTLEQDIDQRTKIRLAFIAGQLSESLNSNQKAIEYFEKVIKYHPDDYEKYFYAQLFITKLTGGDLIGKFEELLKDPNNEPYRGQIYYTLGETYHDNYDFQRAIEAFKKVDDPAYEVNPATKAKAFLAIADISFENEDYPEARKYYEMALGLLSQDDRRYKSARSRSDKLATIVTSIETIQYQDSLLMISEYSEAQKKDLALRIKKDRQAEQEATATAANSGGPSSVSTGGQMTSRFGGASGAANSNFFAYNEKSVTQGRKAFEKTWGNRKLADNWRYSETGGAITADDSAAGGRTLSLGISQTEIDEILQEVPVTPEEKQNIKVKIDQAMLQLGFSFRSDLGDLDKSNETLVELIERKPDREIHAEALYLLFINAREAGNNTQATQYKQLFDSQFGNTNFANKILTSTTAIGQEGIAENALKQVKKDYENGNFDKVLQQSEQSRSMFENRPDLLSQFAMLEALATGKTKGREAYIEKLQYLVANFPQSEEGEKAREYLRILGAEVKTDITASNSNSAAVQFNDKVDNTPHYLIVLTNDNADINPLKASVSDFNKEYFQNVEMSISTVQIQTESGPKPAVLIRRFNTKAEAMDYYRTAEKDKARFMGDIQATLIPLAITNYRFLTTGNKLPQYKEFLSEHYGINF